MRYVSIRGSRLLRPLLLALALAGQPGASALAQVAARPCEAVATRHLDTLGIAESEVQGLHMIAILANSKFGSVIEFQAWVDLASCRGNVVVKLTPACRVKEAYTRGACRLDGVVHF